MCGPGLNLSQTPKNSQPLRSPIITAVGGSRGSVVRGSGRDSNSIAKRFPRKSNGGTGEPREQSGRFPPSVKRLEKSGSWLSYVQPITLLTHFVVQESVSGASVTSSRGSSSLLRLVSRLP
ncbi:hypothetical protein K0M31_017556 [Melipona bicolor]|uniref:Uncharacterized protein n=1 Tax=Melipona bicolor TaxID=60889 RepID=A0AA40G5T6_9HYME|nr:hypothetical protein K0M31_017556 [Melipona bicolor]